MFIAYLEKIGMGEEIRIHKRSGHFLVDPTLQKELLDKYGPAALKEGVILEDGEFELRDEWLYDIQIKKAYRPE